METDRQDVIKKKGRWGMIGAIISAIVASICCLGPLVLLALGISGAWIGNMTVLEPYRPIFMIFVYGFLGTAFYRIYRKPKGDACEAESCCASPRKDRINKAALWSVTVLVLGLLILPYAFPYLSHGGHEKTSAPSRIHSRTITLKVRNMTCSACTVTVAKGLKRLSGVIGAKVSLKPPLAVVEYNPHKVSIHDMITATTGVGYPSSIVEERRN